MLRIDDLINQLHGIIMFARVNYVFSHSPWTEIGICSCLKLWYKFSNFKNEWI